MTVLQSQCIKLAVHAAWISPFTQEGRRNLCVVGGESPLLRPVPALSRHPHASRKCFGTAAVALHGGASSRGDSQVLICIKGHGISKRVVGVHALRKEPCL